MSYSFNENGHLRIEEIVIFVRQECVEGVTHHSRSGEGNRERVPLILWGQRHSTLYYTEFLEDGDHLHSLSCFHCLALPYREIGI